MSVADTFAEHRFGAGDEAIRKRGRRFPFRAERIGRIRRVVQV